jgi:hypothetical protein
MMAYDPNIPPMGSGVPHGPVPDILFPRTPAPNMINARQDGEMTDGAREFSFTPKGRARVYQKPYPEYFDTIPYPRGFRMPDFMKFTGDDAKTTYDHIGQFLAQINNVGITDAHRVRLFPFSLSRTTFNWFTSLPPNSIDTLPQLEQKFHAYFYNGEIELSYLI